MAETVRDSAGLTQAQHRAIELILEGEHYNAIAKELDIHVDTLKKWRSQKQFARHLAKLRTQAVKTAQAIAQSNASYAMQRIAEIMDDPDSTPTQLRAARAIVEFAHAPTIEAFEERIEKLEEAITKAV